MTREEVLKSLRTNLDRVRVSSKFARKRYDRIDEEYCNGKEEGLLIAIELVEKLEVAP